LAFCSELVPDMPIAVQIQVGTPHTEPIRASGIRTYFMRNKHRPILCVCDGQTERTEFFRHRVMLQTTDVQEDDTIQERAFNTEVGYPIMVCFTSTIIYK
jgi:hypothetical protein